MKRFYFRSAIVACLSVRAVASANATIVNDTGLVSPFFYNGTGPEQGHFTVDTESGVEAALRASIRGVGPITPTGSVYQVPIGLDAAGTQALWNFTTRSIPAHARGRMRLPL